MNKYFVKGTNRTPLIHLDADKGLIELKGRSTPEDSDKVYDKVFEWVDLYMEKAQNKTVVNFHFEYINSSTTKALMRLINRLLVASTSNITEVEINWLYCDDDMLEYGEDFEELSGMQFKFINVDYPDIDADNSFDFS